MTSQVVLFNGSGIAIASDSAQTTGGSVVETAEKIFPSPEPHQFAVIISGSAFLHFYPIDTLISEWFATLGTKRLPTAKSYSDSFVQFLDNSGLFSDEWQINFVYRCFVDLLRRVAHLADEDAGESDVVDIVAASTKLMSEFTMPPLDGVDDTWLSKMLDTFLTWDNLQRWCGYQWPQHWVGSNGEDPAEVEQEEVAALRELMVTYLSRSLWEHEKTSVALVGFGEHEIMPSFYHRDLRAHICGKTLGRIQQEQKFDPSQVGRYVGYQALAQADAIELFVRGVAWGIYSAAKGQLEDSLATALLGGESVNEELIAEMKTRSVDAIGRVFQENDKLELFKSTISSLPVASLASVAQALIQVQALSILLDGELRTVGGSIDTAVISRGNGFVWVQHKSIPLDGSSVKS